MAIARVQYANFAASAKSTTHQLAWPGTTAAGSLLIACVGWNEEGTTVTASIAGGSGGWTAIPGSPVERFSAGVGQLKGAMYYKQNAAAQSGNVTLTLSASHFATIHLIEYSGVVLSGGPDQAANANQNGTALVTGTTGVLGFANELRSGFIVCKNTNAQTTPTNSFTQVGEVGQSSGGGGAERSGYYEKIAAATTADSTGATVSAAVDYVGMIATWQAATTGALVQLTSQGIAGAPQQFPLGPPDMSGATPITDTSTTKDTAWTPTHPGDPTNSGLRSGVDYVINCPFVRTRRMMILGGRNVYVPQYLMKFTTATALSTAPDGWMVGIQGGDVGGIVHFDTVHLDNNRLQCDAFKTFKNGGGLSSPAGTMSRTVQIRVCLVEKLVGQSSQVHADLFQTSGGCGDIWIEDFTGSTEYDGFMFQQELNCENQTVFFSVTAASVSGGNYIYTTGAAHGYGVGDPVVVYNPTLSASAGSDFYGGWTISAVTSNTFTVQRGDDASPTALTSGSRVTKVFAGYTVGSHNFNRVNTKGFVNEIQGGNSNQGIRFGVRTAPQPNPGNPGNNPPTSDLGMPSGHVHEDQTPINVTQWNGTLFATNWYGEPDAGTIANWVEPDSNTNNYSGARPTQHAAAGGQPAYASWDSHPQVTAGTKFQQGPPPGGDFVTLNTSGIPIARVPNTGGSGVSLKTTTADATMAVVVAGSFPNAYDNFTRTVGAGGLGTADVGGTYTLTGTAADFSVTGGHALVAVTAAAQTKRAVLANVAMRDQAATATMQTDTTPAGSFTAFDLYLRYVDTNNYYRCRVALNPAGTIQIRWEMTLAGVNTVLKAFVTTPMSVQVANDYTIVAQAIGASPTVLNAFVYDASGPPSLPILFQVAATDSSGALQVVSAAGFGAALNSGSTATATKVSTTYWDVFPVRQTTSVSLTTHVADARLGSPTFTIGTGSKHRPVPAS